MALSEEEMARHYEALQTAISYAIERYQDRQSAAEHNYRGGDVISAYNKGKADAFGYILDDLERWKE